MIRHIELGTIIAPTPLCRLMQESGSDKGGTDANHNYTTYYYSIFNPIRESVTAVFELGLGTTNQSFQCNMGDNGIPGASLRGWKSFFPTATIYGADIDRDILFQEERLLTYYCDQTKPAEIKAMWETIPVEFDVIIEDGLHDFDANVCFFENSIHKLKNGGYYIIEDIKRCFISKYIHQMAQWVSSYPGYSFEIIDLEHPWNTSDNFLMVIRRTS